MTGASSAAAGLPSLTAPPHRRWSAVDVLLLAAVLTLALLLRQSTFQKPATFDELWDLRTTMGNYSSGEMYEAGKLYTNPPRLLSLETAAPIWRVWTNLGGVQHPPLYPLTLRLWREIFGDAVPVARAYSLAWALVGIAFVFAAARLALDRPAAATCGLAMACAPTQIYFAGQARAYAMIGGLAAISIWLITRIVVIGPTRRRAVTLAAMALALMLTHYFSLGLVLTIVVVGLRHLGRQRRIFALCLISAGALYAVGWGPFMSAQREAFAASQANWSAGRWSASREVLDLANAPSRLIVDRSASVEPTSTVFALLMLLPWLLRRRVPVIAPWGAALLGVVALVFAVDLVRGTTSLAVTRYLAAASPVVFLLVAGIGFAINRVAAYALPVAVAIFGAIYWQAGFGIGTDVQSFVPMANEIVHHGEPGEAIVTFDDARPSRWGDFVLLACTTVPEPLPRPFLNLRKPIDAADVPRLGRYVWLAAAREVEPQAIVPGARVIRRQVIDLNEILYHLELPTVTPTTASSPATAASG